MYDDSHPMGFSAVGIAILPSHVDHVADLLEDEVELRFLKIAVPTFFDTGVIVLWYALLGFIRRHCLPNDLFLGYLQLKHSKGMAYSVVLTRK